MATSKTAKVVGNPAIKDGMGITVHGEIVAYTGTIKGAVTAATELVGSVAIIPLNAKAALDRDIKARAPYAQQK